MKNEKALGADAAAVVNDTGRSARVPASGSECEHGHFGGCGAPDCSLAVTPLTHAVPMHTPGPWRVELSENGGYDCMTDALSIKATHRSVVALDLCSYGQGYAGEQALMRNEAEANAHLIAAAPDMLEALKLIVDHFGDPLKVARAAIAKAEGR